MGCPHTRSSLQLQSMLTHSSCLVSLGNRHCSNIDDTCLHLPPLPTFHQLYQVLQHSWLNRQSPALVLPAPQLLRASGALAVAQPHHPEQNRSLQPVLKGQLGTDSLYISSFWSSHGSRPLCLWALRQGPLTLLLLRVQRLICVWCWLKAGDCCCPGTAWAGSRRACLTRLFHSMALTRASS